MLTSEGTCAGPKCAWVDGSCRDTCSTVTNLQECKGTHSPEMAGSNRTLCWNRRWALTG
jgi:hypothetical protein